jgi:hypothetical protein
LEAFSWGPESLTIVNEIIYIQCSGAIFAIQANNAKLLWHFDSTTFVESYEAANGVVYIRLLDGITALRAKDAKELWTFHSDVQGLVVDKDNAALYSFCFMDMYSTTQLVRATALAELRRLYSIVASHVRSYMYSFLFIRVHSWSHSCATYLPRYSSFRINRYRQALHLNTGGH